MLIRNLVLGASAFQHTHTQTCKERSASFLDFIINCDIVSSPWASKIRPSASAALEQIILRYPVFLLFLCLHLGATSHLYWMENMRPVGNGCLPKTELVFSTTQKILCYRNSMLSVSSQMCGNLQLQKVKNQI